MAGDGPKGPIDLSSPGGLDLLAGYAAKDTLFAFDLDGTLAPIMADRDAVRVSGEVRTLLTRLAAHGAVAVITGRSREDARSVLGFDPHLLVGNHGAEWPPSAAKDTRSWSAMCGAWRDRLGELLAADAGVEMEFKGETLALHYRRAPDHEAARLRIAEAVEGLSPSPRVIGGKCVVNLLPGDAPGKGEALMGAMELLGCRRAVYLGDDLTDEEVFGLPVRNLLGIRVGRGGATAAACFVEDQSQVLGVLVRIVEIMEGRISRLDKTGDPIGGIEKKL